MIEFKNPRVAKIFEAAVEADRIVHVPGKYSGLLSNISVAGAKKMFADGDTQLVAKTTNPEEIKAGPEDDKEETEIS